MARYLSNNPIKSKLYWKWSNMKQRCGNKNNPRYHVYGAKGIRVCKEWMKFENFYKDMSLTFKKGLTLDRIDSNKDYSKQNCRWVSQKIQQNNRTNNRCFEYNGVKDTLANWATRTGIKQNTLWMRLYHYNWPIEKALQGGSNLG